MTDPSTEPTTPEPTTPEPTTPEPTGPTEPTEPTPETFAAYLVRTRWFGGKGRPFAVTGSRVVGEVPGREPQSPWVDVHLVDVAYDDVEPDALDARETYQVPLALYVDAQPRLDHAFLGWWRDPERGWVHAYDAVHDREAMACWLRSFAAGEQGGELTFHRIVDHPLDLQAHSSLFSGEQSNSSVAFGEDSLLKIFRKVTPGANPDITIHRALSEAGSGDIATLYGFVEAPAPDAGGRSYDLGMLQQFLRTATDGWDLALASVRTLLASEDRSVEESGGDFAGEAAMLGESLRAVHAVLAGLGAGTVPAAELAQTMTRRLRTAVRAVPELAEHEARLAALFARVADLGDVEVQRVHGDLHLGQTLRTSQGWKLVDFEGEPAKTLEERVRPDAPWRDVAGMLRSFDYAPRVVARSREAVDELEVVQLDTQAEEWSARARTAFVTAYAGGEPDADAALLLEAYVADKAVYETVYEARNRPTWTTVPLAAIARIGARP